MLLELGRFGGIEFSQNVTLGQVSFHGRLVVHGRSCTNQDAD
jgi:hypothetical protein